MTTPRTGRCQHCEQTRPLYRHDGELQFWGYDPSEAAWLCARCWSDRETAIEADDPFHLLGNDPFAALAAGGAS